MLKKSMQYAAGLIALYLVVEYATGFAKSINATSSGSVGVIKAFQGR